MQLDIFADSRDTVLRNGVIDAFLRGDFRLARAAMASLAAEYPEDCLLPPAAVLLEVEKLPLPRETTERQSLVLLIDRCDQEIVVAAATVLGQNATAWMRKQVWSQLANASAELPFDPDYPDAFVAPLWLRAARGLAPTPTSSGSPLGGASRFHCGGRSSLPFEAGISIQRSRGFSNWHGWLQACSRNSLIVSRTPFLGE